MSTVKSHEKYHSAAPPSGISAGGGHAHQGPQKKSNANCQICQLRERDKSDTIGTTFQVVVPIGNSITR